MIATDRALTNLRRSSALRAGIRRPPKGDTVRPISPACVCNGIVAHDGSRTAHRQSESCLRVRFWLIAAQAALLLVLAPSLGWSFKPDPLQDGHWGMTRAALQQPFVVNGRSYGFSDDAIFFIQANNAATDLSPTYFQSEAHCDSETLAECSERLINMRAEISYFMVGSDSFEARRAFGTALHTLQDFYAHSNWLETRGAVVDPQLGVQPLPAPSSLRFCRDDPATGWLLQSEVQLTSGYFTPALTGCGAPARRGKCAHGNAGFPCSNESVPSGRDGINKDSVNEDPENFGPAKETATLATRQFAQMVLQDLAAVPSGIACFTGTVPCYDVAFVVDTSASMADDLALVRTAVADLITKQPLLGRIVLVTFADTIRSTVVFSHPFDALAAVDGLQAQGGGDPREAAVTALGAAVGKVGPKSFVFLFTDAGAKDADRANIVAANARAKAVTIVVVPLAGALTCPTTLPTTATLARSDASHLESAALPNAPVRELAAALGGHVQVGALRTDLLAMLLRSEGTLSGAPREFEVAVDATIATLVLSTEVAAGTVTLRRPSGALVINGEAGVTVVVAGTATQLEVVNPEPGMWQLRLEGTGAFDVTARAASDLVFGDFRFVQMMGRPAHEGLGPIPGEPVTGAQTGMAHLDGPFSTAQFQLVGVDGSVLSSLALVRGNLDTAGNEFVGNVPLPPQPVRIMASGNDDTGHQYQRVYPLLFAPQPVDVAVANAPSRLWAGGGSEVAFTVTNHGPAGDFDVEVADDRGFVHAAPLRLTLAAGGVAQVTAQIAVPGDTPRETIVTVTASAVSPTDVHTGNRATLLLVVDGLPADTPAALLCGKAKLQGNGNGAPTEELVSGTTPGGFFDIGTAIQLCAGATPDAATGTPPYYAGYGLRRSKNLCASAAPTNAGSACHAEEDCGGMKSATKWCAKTPHLSPPVSLHVQNAVAETNVTPKKAQILSLPAAPASLASPVIDAALAERDQYLCWTAALTPGTPALPKNLRVVTPRGRDSVTWSLKKLTRVCVPVQSEEAGVHWSTQGFVCYSAKAAKPGPPPSGTLSLTTRRGLVALRPGPVREVCVPSRIETAPAASPAPPNARAQPTDAVPRQGSQANAALLDVCPSECGDNQVSGSEECDGTDLGSCESGCTSLCTCAGVCGNGVLDPNEPCEQGTPQDAWTCPAGDPCTPDCECRCGNGVVDTGEQCDDGEEISSCPGHTPCRECECFRSHGMQILPYAFLTAASGDTYYQGCPGEWNSGTVEDPLFTPGYPTGTVNASGCGAASGAVASATFGDDDPHPRAIQVEMDGHAAVPQPPPPPPYPYPPATSEASGGSGLYLAIYSLYPVSIAVTAQNNCSSPNWITCSASAYVKVTEVSPIYPYYRSFVTIVAPNAQPDPCFGPCSPANGASVVLPAGKRYAIEVVVSVGANNEHALSSVNAAASLAATIETITE